MTEEEALEEWTALAKDKPKWYQAQRKILGEMRMADEADQWQNRHDEDRPQDERTRQMLKAISEAHSTGEWKCPHCQRELQQYGFRSHVHKCTGRPPETRRAKPGNCQHCGGYFLSRAAHERRCQRMRDGSAITQSRSKLRPPQPEEAQGAAAPHPPGAEAPAVSDLLLDTVIA